jgi:hypothetical protein
MIKESTNYQIIFDGAQVLPWERKWAIQANESGLNGDFMLRDVTGIKTPFRIGANAPDNALTVLPLSGNIGVGTLTPAVRLDVKANAAGLATERLQNSSATGYSGTEYLDNAGNVDLFFGIDNAASTTRLNSVNNNPIVVLTNSAERMRITSAGNVGIGTASPGAKLHLFDNADVFTRLAVQNTSSGANAVSSVQVLSDTAFATFQAQGSGRNITHFGQVVAGWAELLLSTGDGLASWALTM